MPKWKNNFCFSYCKEMGMIMSKLIDEYKSNKSIKQLISLVHSLDDRYNDVYYRFAWGRINTVNGGMVFVCQKNVDEIKLVRENIDNLVDGKDEHKLKEEIVHYGKLIEKLNQNVVSMMD